MNTSTFRQITKIILTAYLLEFNKIKKKIVSVYFKLKTIAVLLHKDAVPKSIKKKMKQ